MDILQLFTEVLGLSAFIFATVAQLKKFGLRGQWLTFSAFAAGLVFGGCYRYFMYNPQTPLEWFWVVLFGLGSAYVATGAYDGLASASGKQKLDDSLDELYSDSGLVRDEPTEDGR